MSRLRALLRDPTARLAAVVLGYLAGALAALAAVTWFSLGAAQRDDLVSALAGQAATFVLGGALAAAGLVWLLLRGPGVQARRLRRMAADVRLLAHNPQHRLPEDGPAQLAGLAAAVNELAATLRAAGTVDDAAAAAADLERSRLAAVLADLTVPVLVLSLGGRVQLYNSAARAVLGDAVSLGRSVEGLLDLAAMRRAPDGPVVVAGTAPDGGPLRARVAPVRDPHGDDVTGYVAVLDSDVGVDVLHRVVVGDRPEFYDFSLPDDVARQHADQALRELTCTVLDTETTGFSPEVDEVVQVGAVRVVGGRVRRQEVLDRLVDPRRAIPPTATAVHGVVVGHNVAFDLAFLRRRDGVGLTDLPALDTLLLDAFVHPDHDDHGLDAVAARLGVEVTGRHSALGDALVTAEVLVRLLPLLEARGTTTVGQALEACRAVARARAGTGR